MEPIRTVVCDDEPDTRGGLLELLRQDAEIEIVGEARDGAEAVSLLTAVVPELVFLDVQMPEHDGFGVVGAVAEALGDARVPTVVFVTAFDEYALRAFDVHALDYLLKPFSDARLTEALRVAKERVIHRRAGVLGQQLAALFATAGSPIADVARRDTHARRSTDTVRPAGRDRWIERIAVRNGQKVFFVPVADIDWIEADDYYARLHVAGRTALVREALNQLESALDPSRFVRTHRSAIVNISRVKLLQPYFGGAHVITLHDGTQVPLSRSRRSAFERALGSHI